VPVAVGKALLQYTRFRVLDFIDIFEAEAGVGLGVFAGGSVTYPLRLGVGYAENIRYGFNARKAARITRTEIGIPFNYLAVWLSAKSARRETDKSKGIRLVSVRGRRVPHPRARVPFVRRFDVWASVTVGVVSGRAGVHLGEAVDFLLGFLTIDLPHDDRTSTPGPAAPSHPIPRRMRQAKPKEGYPSHMGKTCSRVSKRDAL